MSTLLEVRGLVRDYRLLRSTLLGPPPVRRALDGVSLTIGAGQCLGLVGESGSGKSTLARAVMGVEPPDAGSVRLMGKDLYALPAAELRSLRRHFQMVFQDPDGSLDPRHKVGRIVAEPLFVERSSGAEARARVAAALRSVGIEPAMAERYPHELSGGQRQRVAIARALVTEPSLVVADEPVSALDMSIQAQVLALMLDLKRRLGLAFLLISHDLAVVAHMADRVAVLKEGRIVEQGETAAVLRQPGHPYTRELLAATLPADPARARAALLRANA
ncbi:MAG TPA: ABC transporter ATP-binding protein [Geminicoccaceae bacterium]|nr:ABC transporter ATP-binding protein [Geminicoccus sp.]HMU50067.1 ABC transporter ATP-binding protein [Geminicoccaceae bacterium]